MTPKVTLYVTAHNYGRYLRQAVESALSQTFSDFELLVYDDGSTDDTAQVLAGLPADPRLHVFRQERATLPKTANRALGAARGEYVVRLDADDYLDESFLLVLVATLDARKDVDLVYSDYYEIDDAGSVTGVYRRDSLRDGVLLDLPSHGACTMYRTAVLRKLGGYWEDIGRGDGMGVWVRFIQEHRAHNVRLPLFYYRKHPVSATTNVRALRQARADILQKFVSSGDRDPTAGLILPIRRMSDVEDALPLKLVAGEPLLLHALKAAVGSRLGPVAVVTEDRDIAEVCRAVTGVQVVPRPEALGRPDALLSASIRLVLDAWLAQDVDPEIVGVVFYTSPLTGPDHLRQAVNTIATYGCDSVVSVRENFRLHYTHEERGLVPLFKRRGLKLERDMLYEESGAFVFGRREAMLSDSGLGETIGHVALAEEASVDIEDQYTLWLAERILEGRAELAHLSSRARHRGY